MPRIQLIDLPVSNQTSSRDVPTTLHGSPIDAESNGTSLTALPQCVALLGPEAKSIRPLPSAAMPKIKHIDVPVSNQTSSPDMPTISHTPPNDAESNGTSHAPLAQSVVPADLDAPSMRTVNDT